MWQGNLKNRCDGWGWGWGGGHTRSPLTIWNAFINVQLRIPGDPPPPPPSPPPLPPWTPPPHLPPSPRECSAGERYYNNNIKNKTTVSPCDLSITCTSPSVRSLTRRICLSRPRKMTNETQTERAIIRKLLLANTDCPSSQH